MNAPLNDNRNASPRSRQNKIRKRRGRCIDIPVGEGSGGPLNSDAAWRPNAEDNAALWDGDPPLFDKSRHRAVYDVNKELANDLNGRVTVKVGRIRARTLFKIIFLIIRAKAEISILV
jgi:hypothetical protein